VFPQDDSRWIPWDNVFVFFFQHHGAILLFVLCSLFFFGRERMTSSFSVAPFSARIPSQFSLFFFFLHRGPVEICVWFLFSFFFFYHQKLIVYVVVALFPFLLWERMWLCILCKISLSGYQCKSTLCFFFPFLRLVRFLFFYSSRWRTIFFFFAQLVRMLFPFFFFFIVKMGVLSVFCSFSRWHTVSFLVMFLFVLPAIPDSCRYVVLFFFFLDK